MKIVLKDADFSQSGIPTPHEVVFDGSKMYNVFTGNLVDNSNAQRGADVSSIPISNNKVNNNSGFALSLFIMFYAANDTYLGCVSYDGQISAAILGVDASLRIDQCSHYMKPVDASHMTEMSVEEVASLKANMSYWRIAAVASGAYTISDVSVSLEIVE